MVKDLSFIPECFIDTYLTQVLLSVGVNHQHCCSQVTGTMENAFKDQFAVGIIDDDKRKTTYVEEFTEVSRSQHVILKKHPRRPHYLLLVCPAMERFILDCVKQAGLDMNDYGLPSTLAGLCDQTKSVNSIRDPRFLLLFNDLAEKCPEVKGLKNALIYLRNNVYSAKEEELAIFFES